MDTRTVGELRILAPDLDPRDLDDVTEPPEYELDEAKVDGADWAGLQLGGGLRLSHLTGVSLAQATWRNATVYGCRFERVDFSGAQLAGLTVERCTFVGCRMTGVQVRDSTLKNVLFEDCRLDYASLTDVRATGSVGWVGCKLDNATLTKCQLPAVALRSCSLDTVEFRDCDLRGADLRGNDLSGTNGLSSLRGVRLAAGQLLELAAVAVRTLDIALDPEP